MLLDVVFVKVMALARLSTLLRLIPAPAFTVKLFAPPVPIVNKPVLLIAPVVAPPPIVLKVRLFGVVTLLFNVIAPPLVWKIQGPDGLVTPVTVASVPNVPVCATSPMVNAPVVVIVFNALFDNPNPVTPLPVVIATLGVLLVKLTAPDPPVIVPPARDILSAVRLIAVAPLPFVNVPALFVNVPVPAFTVIPPGPVTVLVFVTPLPVKLTLPLPPAVTAFPVVNKPAVCNVMLDAPEPVVTVP